MSKHSNEKTYTCRFTFKPYREVRFAKNHAMYKRLQLQEDGHETVTVHVSGTHLTRPTHCTDNEWQTIQQSFAAQAAVRTARKALPHRGYNRRYQIEIHFTTDGKTIGAPLILGALSADEIAFNSVYHLDRITHGGLTADELESECRSKHKEAQRLWKQTQFEPNTHVRLRHMQNAAITLVTFGGLGASAIAIPLFLLAVTDSLSLIPNMTIAFSAIFAACVAMLITSLTLHLMVNTAHSRKDKQLEKAGMRLPQFSVVKSTKHENRHPKKKELS